MIGIRLKLFAEKKGVSQYRMAKELEVAQPTLTRYFQGAGEPAGGILAKVARVYPELNIRWLLTGDGEMLEKSAAMEASVSS